MKWVRKWTSWVGQTMLFPRSEGFFFKAPEVFLVYNFHKPAKTSIIVPKPYSFLVDSDATFDTGGGWHVDWKSSSWVGQAMQFPCFEGFFFKVPEVFHVHNFHKPAKTSIIVPKPYNFLVESDATFDTGGGWNAVRKWTSWVGQAMLFPRSEGFFFKAPEVFLVYNFHKPAKTSIIVPKPYSFFVESDATFDIGGSWNVDWKWFSWVGQAIQFPCFEGFFFKVPEVFHVHNFHKPAKTSIIVPKPYSFLVESDATFDIGGRVEMWTENGPSTTPCCFPVLKGFFSRPQRSSLSTTSTSLPKPALSYQNLIIF